MGALDKKQWQAAGQQKPAGPKISAYVRAAQNSTVALESMAAVQKSYEDMVEAIWSSGPAESVIRLGGENGRLYKINQVKISILKYVQQPAFWEIMQGGRAPKPREVEQLIVTLLIHEWVIAKDCYVYVRDGRFAITPTPEFNRRLILSDPNISGHEIGVVYPDEEFTLIKGSQPRIMHRPNYLEVRTQGAAPLLAYGLLWKGANPAPAITIYLDRTELNLRTELARGNRDSSPYAKHNKPMIEAKMLAKLAKYATPYEAPYLQTLAAKNGAAASMPQMAAVIADISDYDEDISESAEVLTTDGENLSQGGEQPLNQTTNAASEFLQELEEADRTEHKE
jgi:hypothetical protein